MAIIAARPHPPTKKVGGYSLCRTFRKQLMSALGQKQTSAAQKSHVRFTPESGHVRCICCGYPLEESAR